MKTSDSVKTLAALAAVLLLSTGCDGASKADLSGLEQRLDTKVGQAETKIAQMAAELDRKITATDSKYANMLAIEQQVKNGMESIEKNSKQLELTNDVVRQLLEAQRAALKEQLASIEEQLAVLKKR